MHHLHGIHINPLLVLGIHTAIHRGMHPHPTIQLTQRPHLHPRDRDMVTRPISQI